MQCLDCNIFANIDQSICLQCGNDFTIPMASVVTDLSHITPLEADISIGNFNNEFHNFGARFEEVERAADKPKLLHVLVDERKRILLQCSLSVFDTKFSCLIGGFGPIFEHITITGTLEFCDQSVSCVEDNYYRDKIVCMFRGGTSFYQKVLFAQTKGAKCVLIFNTNNIWPFIMTTKNEKDENNISINIPLLIISKDDSDIIIRNLKCRKQKQVICKLDFIGMENECSICKEDFNIADEVYKLHCSHLFHRYCLSLWIDKNTCCPLCKEFIKFYKESVINDDIYDMS